MKTRNPPFRTGVDPMSWNDTRLTSLDCAAAVAGVVFALPLILAITLPFIGGH
jgi:hypothetical protein